MILVWLNEEIGISSVISIRYLHGSYASILATNGLMKKEIMNLYESKLFKTLVHLKLTFFENNSDLLSEVYPERSSGSPLSLA